MCILEELYNNFYEPTPQLALNSQVTKNHQELIKTLSKDDRKKILSIIDDLVLIELLQTKDSFICGVKFAMGLNNQLNNYAQSDYVIENPQTQSFLSSKVQDEHN